MIKDLIANIVQQSAGSKTDSASNLQGSDQVAEEFKAVLAALNSEETSQDLTQVKKSDNKTQDLSIAETENQENIELEAVNASELENQQQVKIEEADIESQKVFGLENDANLSTKNDVTVKTEDSTLIVNTEENSVNIDKSSVPSNFIETELNSANFDKNSVPSNYIETESNTAESQNSQVENLKTQENAKLPTESNIVQNISSDDLATSETKVVQNDTAKLNENGQEAKPITGASETLKQNVDAVDRDIFRINNTSEESRTANQPVEIENSPAKTESRRDTVLNSEKTVSSNQAIPSENSQVKEVRPGNQVLANQQREISTEIGKSQSQQTDLESEVIKESPQFEKREQVVGLDSKSNTAVVEEKGNLQQSAANTESELQKKSSNESSLFSNSSDSTSLNKVAEGEIFKFGNGTNSLLDEPVKQTLYQSVNIEAEKIQKTEAQVPTITQSETSNSLSKKPASSLVDSTTILNSNQKTQTTNFETVSRANIQNNEVLVQVNQTAKEANPSDFSHTKNPELIQFIQNHKTEVIKPKEAKEQRFALSQTEQAETRLRLLVDSVRPEILSNREAPVGFITTHTLDEKIQFFNPTMTLSNDQEALLKEFMVESIQGKDQKAADQNTLGFLRLGELPIANSTARRSIINSFSNVLKQEMSSSLRQEEQWQKHSFKLDDGNNINMTTRNIDGVLQIKLVASNPELNRLLMSMEQEIKDHLKEELNLELDLQFTGNQNEEFSSVFGDSSDNKKQSWNQSGSGQNNEDQNKEDVRGLQPSIRSFGYNQMEWTA